MSNRVLTAASLLAAFAGSAFAAPQGDELPPNQGLREMRDAPRNARVANTQGTGAEQTTLQLIYEIAGPTDAGVPGGTLFGSGNSPRVFDVGTLRTDQGFSTNAAVATAFGFGWNSGGSGTTPINNFDILFRFFATPNEGTPTNNSSTVTPFYSNLFATLRVPDLCADPGFVQWFPTPIQFTDENSNVITVTFFDAANSAPVTKFGYETNMYEVGSSSVFNTRVNNFRMGGTLQPRVGTNDFRGWAFGLGSSVGAGSTPWVFGDNSRELFQREANGTAAARRDSYLKMWAQLPTTVVPPETTDLGVIDCTAGVLPAFTTTIALDPGAVVPVLGQWFKFSTPVDIQSPDVNFLDISVETDDTGIPMPVSFGMFADNGGRILTDFRRGSGAQYPLATFGHGRRPGVGGIEERDRPMDRDGRDGPLAAGTYYLFVSGQEARYGGSSFAVDASLSTATGTARLVFDTNANTTNCPLPTPVAPTVARDLGAIDPGTITTVNDVQNGVRAVTWYTFTTSFDVLPSNSNFVDIHNVGSDLGQSAMALYDSTGAAVSTTWFDGESGGLYFGTNPACPPVDNRAQLSFGGASIPRPALGPGLPFAGQNGDTLNAGTYYLALGVDNLLVRDNSWQARSTSGSFIFIWATVRTPFQCDADYNRDGQLNLDDLSDFITDFYTIPTIPGGLQANAPTYSDNALVGFGIGCPNAPSAPTPYDIDAYRQFGYRVGFSLDGSNTCPSSPEQNFPSLDNLSEYISYYYTRFGGVDCSGL
jgi:hypothetical protein